MPTLSKLIWIPPARSCSLWLSSRSSERGVRVHSDLPSLGRPQNFRLGPSAARPPPPFCLCQLDIQTILARSDLLFHKTMQLPPFEYLLVSPYYVPRPLGMESACKVTPVSMPIYNYCDLVVRGYSCPPGQDARLAKLQPLWNQCDYITMDQAFQNRLSL